MSQNDLLDKEELLKYREDRGQSPNFDYLSPQYRQLYNNYFKFSLKLAPCYS